MLNSFSKINKREINDLIIAKQMCALKILQYCIYYFIKYFFILYHFTGTFI